MKANERQHLRLVAWLLVVASSSLAWPSGLALADASADLSLPVILESVKKSSDVQQFDKAAAAWGEAAFRAASEQSRGAWNVEGEATVGQDRSSQRGERRVGTFLGKSVRFGVDRDALRQQYAAEASSLMLEAQGALAERQLIAGRSFAGLLHFQRLYRSYSLLLDKLSPLLAGAERAALQGGVDALSLLKWKIFRQQISASRAEAAANYQAAADQLKIIIPHSVIGTIGEAKFLDPVTELKAAGSEGLPRVRSLREQAKAHVSRGRAAGEATELNVALGLERDFVVDSNALVARVSLPLGQKTVSHALRSEAMAQSSVVSLKADLTEEALRREIGLLEQKLALDRRRVALLEAQKGDVAKLHQTTAASLRRGMADVAQLMEASEKLFALEQELSKAIYDVQTDVVELIVVSGGAL